MRAWRLGLALALMAAPAAAADDPLLRPIAPDTAKAWLGAQGPIHLYGNSYLVGPAGLDVALIRTSAGLILIDGAFPQAVPMIEANIRALGLSIRDIRWILSTEPHWDHASGMAALARDSGATVVAGAAAVPVLRGASDPTDPQGALQPYSAPARIRAIGDGETLRLGDVTVTAHATPSHTAGSTGWSWQSCEGADCKAMVFAASLTAIAGTGYRFTAPDHAPTVASFRASFATLRVMPCDILITSHPFQSGLDRKIAAARADPATNPFIDPGACRAYAAYAEKLLDDQMASEAKP